MTVMRLARLLRGMPIYLLGRRTALSPSRVSLIERGYVTPHDDELARVARALQVSKARLLERVSIEALLVGTRDG
jgi:transcriptional regulator with XRE-family HTH domain